MNCPKVFRMAHVWEEFFSFASADAQAMVEAGESKVWTNWTDLVCKDQVLGSSYAFDRGWL